MPLVLEGVSKVMNGQTHIYPTDLELQSGTMNVLLGPTSSGKTSLMRLMAGLDVPNKGKVIWGGKDVTGMRVQDRGVAMVYQQFINYPSMTVYDNIASPMRLLKQSESQIDAAVKKAADLMKLTPFLDRKPLALSGGQQQRCALARALVKDAWLSMAGVGDKGEPNGLPVDEWGIRVNEKSQPVGSCVSRGGDTNGPAAVYAVTKAIEWLQKYSPPAAAGMTFSEAGPIPAQGNVAQQMFWYTAFTAASIAPDLPVMNADGTPKWRMAPSPHGAYWTEGTKIGYQDAGSWTLMESTPVDRAQAAWLYAQFVTSKTVDVKKSHVGLTFIRESTIQHESFTERAPKLGGLIEFYRSPARVQWSPTGTNVPDYPKLAQLWWQNIGDAMSGAKTPQEALDALCADQEKVLIRLERSGVQGDLGPVMNEEVDPQVWFDAPGAPQPKLANEDETPVTIAYEELIKSWQ